MNGNQLDTLIERYTPELTELWRKICETESKSGDRAALCAVADLIESAAASYGFTVHRKPFEATGDYMTVDFNEGREKGYAFLAHIDTVHERGAFGSPAVTVDGDVMKGPGVIDCKGGIAVALLAMRALFECGCDRHTRLILSSDEEVSNILSCCEGAQFIRDNAAGFKGVFNCEVGVDGEAVVARRGILRAKVTVNGISAHAGIAYFDGASAVREAAHKIITFEEKSTRGGTTYNCGLIKGGRAANIVPDRCEFFVDARVITSADMDEAERFIRETTARCFVPGTTATLEIVSHRPPMNNTPAVRELFGRLSAVSEQLGQGRLTAVESGGGSDSAYVQQAGVPVVCGLGATGDFCHTVNEYARISSLPDRARLLAHTINADIGAC